MNPTDIQENTEIRYRRLYSWAYRAYGKGGFWRKALDDATIKLKKVEMKTNWTIENVRSKMLERHMSGKSMDYSSVIDDDPALEAAGRHYYRSWNKALRSIGLNADELVKQREPYSEQDIILGIVMYYFQGENLNGNIIGKKGITGLKNIRRASYRKFNSWPQAVKEAGIDYSQFLTITQRDEENVLTEIQDLHEQGIALNSRYIRKYFKNTFNAAERYIGPWGKAVGKAGFDYDVIKKTRPPKTSPKRKHKHRTKIPKQEELIYIAQALDQYQICLDEGYVSSSKELKKILRQSNRKGRLEQIPGEMRPKSRRS